MGEGGRLSIIVKDQRKLLKAYHEIELYRYATARPLHSITCVLVVIWHKGAKVLVTN